MNAIAPLEPEWGEAYHGSGVPRAEIRRALRLAIERACADFGACLAAGVRFDPKMNCERGHVALQLRDVAGDAGRVAQAFADAGFVDVVVSHRLHDPASLIRNGVDFGGARTWDVEFTISRGGAR